MERESGVETFEWFVREGQGSFLRARVTIEEFQMNLEDVLLIHGETEFIVVESRTQDGFVFDVILKKKPS